MLGSTMLELALGMAFIYLLLSLLVSAIREAVEARLKARAADLERGIGQLLGQDAKAFYEHPLVRSLYAGSSLPSYIPRSVFAAVVLERLRKDAPQQDPRDPAQFAQWVSALSASQTALKAATTAMGAARTLDEAVKSLEDWYDSAMDRVSGWYKRKTQRIVFWLGLLVAVLLNVDSIALVRYLDTDPKARGDLVEAAARSMANGDGAHGKSATAGAASAGAGTAASQPGSATPAASAASDAAAASAAGSAPNVPKEGCPPGQSAGTTGECVEQAGAVLDAVDRLVGLHLPIGWDRAALDKLFTGGQADTAQDRRAPALPLLSAILGWLLTAFAISFGAPFWFDVLNKIMVVRSTVKPKEKSGDEASEDRRG